MSLGEIPEDLTPEEIQLWLKRDALATVLQTLAAERRAHNETRAALVDARAARDCAQASSLEARNVIHTIQAAYDKLVGQIPGTKP